MMRERDGKVKKGKRGRARDRETRGRWEKRETESAFCSMSGTSTVRMCYMICYTLHCLAADCLAIRVLPHAVTELLLPVQMTVESPVEKQQQAPPLVRLKMTCHEKGSDV